MLYKKKIFHDNRKAVYSMIYSRMSYLGCLQILSIQWIARSKYNAHTQPAIKEINPFAKSFFYYCDFMFLKLERVKLSVRAPYIEFGIFKNILTILYFIKIV
jgi:hypothetical protein